MRNTYATTVIISLDSILLNNQIHPRWHNMWFDSMENSSPVLSSLQSFIIICPVKSNSIFFFIFEKLSNFKYSFAGWKDSILSLPKRWLSQQSTDTDEYGFPLVSYTVNLMKTHLTKTSYDNVVIYHRIKLSVFPHLRWSEIKSILHVVELSNMKLSPPLINGGELDFFHVAKKRQTQSDSRTSKHTRENRSHESSHEPSGWKRRKRSRIELHNIQSGSKNLRARHSSCSTFAGCTLMKMTHFNLEFLFNINSTERDEQSENL